MTAFHCFVLRADLSFACAHEDCKGLRKMEKDRAERRRPVGHDWPLSGSGNPNHGPGYRTPGW